MAIETLEPRVLLADGSLDPTFGTGGIVTTLVGAAGSAAGALAIGPDGKIVVAGGAWNGTDYDMAVTRYNADGSLDTTFSGDGKVLIQFGSGEGGLAVKIDGNGKIVVAGITVLAGAENKYGFAIARLNADGSLDTSFGGDGKVVTIIGESGYATSLAIADDGKIVAAGFAYGESPTYFAVVRYNTDGTLDSSFDADGLVTTEIGTAVDVAFAATIDGDGKIVVAGTSFDATQWLGAVVRYNRDGSLDSSFDGDGKATIRFDSNLTHLVAVATDANNKVVVAGESIHDFGSMAGVARLNNDGTLDTSFDGDGKVTYAIGDRTIGVSGAAIDHNGKIVVVGHTWNDFDSDLALARINPDGSFDNTFDGDGRPQRCKKCSCSKLPRKGFPGISIGTTVLLIGVARAIEPRRVAKCSSLRPNRCFTGETRTSLRTIGIFSATAG